jgi:ABC-type phosphate/phosphonate transport system substrate-binding protein
MKRFSWMISGAVVAALLTALAVAPSPAASGATEVRIGIVKTLFRDVPEVLIPIGLRPMKALMEGQTGYGGDLVPCGEADALARQIKADEVQFGVFHGVEFAWVHETYPTLKPLVIAVNGPPFLRAHLVVRSDSKIAAPANLEGKVVALPRMSREHCRLYFERRCCPADQDPAKYFGRVTTPSTPESALDDVVDDEAQGAVVDEKAYEDYQKNKPGRAVKLKSLAQSESFPCAVLAYQDGALSDKMLASFHDGLIAAKENAKVQTLLRMNRLTGFEAVPAGYEKELSEISKAYPAAGAK